MSKTVEIFEIHDFDSGAKTLEIFEIHDFDSGAKILETFSWKFAIQKFSRFFQAEFYIIFVKN